MGMVGLNDQWGFSVMGYFTILGHALSIRICHDVDHIPTVFQED